MQDDGPIRIGKAAIRKQWVNDVDVFGLRDMKLAPLRVEVAGDAIYEIGMGEGHVVKPRTGETSLFKFKYVNVWRRQPDGRWLLDVDAYSGLTYED